MTRRLFPLVGMVVAPILALADEPKAAEYRSPYSVRFTHPVKELIRDLEETDRGKAQDSAVVPFPEWYSPAIRTRWGVWGPAARHYPHPEYVDGKSADWKRERVVAAALRFQGYGYQHHHVPDWNPPADWPWLKVQAGHNGKGVDCSNYTAFVYNQAFGIKPTGAIREQSEQLEMKGPDGKKVRAERIELPGAYADRPKSLKTGDLLFIKGKVDGDITHVVIWVGSIGRSPDDTPLILDSHGQGVKDAAGVNIPDGIQLRPFRENSWYGRCASHAIRIIRDE
ncbi:NlpC/P60 family protein [Fimbriiglobus ruber]|uniref:NlpC/P60 domain-containing protein n=1 Tax=Fimbriiglobus ruber TaxID=1908690 RepID=A0A225DUK3_9BACT|nr:NlpC/P60 family protein [Fimbriiglobus ruber]OWK45082.1 hypothetical protein FRUB_01413 [Fimbriiglobus ruber]